MTGTPGAAALAAGSAAAPVSRGLVQAIPALHRHPGVPRCALRGVRTSVTAADRELTRPTLLLVLRPADAGGRNTGVVPPPADRVRRALRVALAGDPASGLRMTRDAAIAPRVVGVVALLSGADDSVPAHGHPLRDEARPPRTQPQRPAQRLATLIETTAQRDDAGGRVARCSPQPKRARPPDVGEEPAQRPRGSALTAQIRDPRFRQRERHRARCSGAIRGHLELEMP